MMTLGLKDVYPYRVIADFCEFNDLLGHRMHLDNLFHASFGYPPRRIVECPLDITQTYFCFTHLLRHLYRLMEQSCYPFKIRTYRENAILKMVRYVRRFRQSDDIPSHYCHTPGNLSHRELHMPYAVLSDILRWKSLEEWETILYNWQLNALCGSLETCFVLESDDLEAYRNLQKIMDICYLIYAVELDFTEVKGPVSID